MAELTRTATPTSIVNTNEPPPDPDAADTWESSLGDGRNSRHQVFAVLLIDDHNQQWMVPYSSIAFGKGKFNGNEFIFRCALDHVYDVVLQGPQLQYAIEKLAAGKRETLHTRGAGTTSIKFVEVRQEAESAD
jgi:hypothetical protein